MFTKMRHALAEHLDPDSPLVTAMDDSLLNKAGKKIVGASWRRDPLGPPFQTNLIWAQRFLQLSAALPASNGQTWARMIPISLQHCPSPKKPRRNANLLEIQEYKEACKKMALTTKAAELLISLRSSMDQEPSNQNRKLVCSVDGGYTNNTVFKNLPHDTVLIGRIRKDAKIYNLPKPSTGKPGRIRRYGHLLPIPEAIRQDSSIEWQQVDAWAAGKMHQFRIKSVGPIRWRKAGVDKDLRLIIIAPLAYRPTKKSRLLYRDPAYLVCTDTEMPLQKIIQYYIWRWDIEVNFRDEKTILGMGKAQVRHANSVEQVPQFIAAVYAMLQIAAWRAFRPDGKNEEVMPKPIWNKKKNSTRISTNTMISRLRAELWAKAIGSDNYSNFVNHSDELKSYKNGFPNMATAVLYARQ